MSTIFVTFGSQYAREPHPRLPFAHPDGYLTIEAPDYRTARGIAMSMTGGAFCTDYLERPSDIQFQRGELARVIVHDPIVTESVRDQGMAVTI